MRNKLWLISLVMAIGGCATNTLPSPQEHYITIADIRQQTGTNNVINYDFYTNEQLIKLLGRPNQIIQKYNQEILSYYHYSFITQDKTLVAMNYQDGYYPFQLAEPCTIHNDEVNFKFSSHFQSIGQQCTQQLLLNTRTLEYQYAKSDIQEQANIFIMVQQYNPKIYHDKTALIKQYHDLFQSILRQRFPDKSLRTTSQTVGKYECYFFDQQVRDLTIAGLADKVDIHINDAFCIIKPGLSIALQYISRSPITQRTNIDPKANLLYILQHTKFHL